MQEEQGRDQALRALRGAAKFSEQLESALRMGPESIYRAAYAVKIRVKSEDSLVEKVIDRSKKRKDYNAYKVTDIVGVRFVCIHSRDLLELCRLFVRTIPFLQSPSVQLLQGDTHDAAIREVIVYTTGASGADYEDCLNFFQSPELGLDVRKVSQKRLDKEDQRQYSSIHIVCKGRCYHDSINLRIPLEIQIRTAFEDVWGAIQHDVEYKRKFLTKTDKWLAERYSNAISQLNALKLALQGATGQADAIRAEIDQIRKLTEPTAPASLRTVRRPLSIAGRARYPVEVRAEAVILDTKIDQIFQTVIEEYNGSGAATKSISTLEQGLLLIDNFLRLYDEADHKRYEGDIEGRFPILMDRALIHFWLSRAFLRNGREDQAQQAIERAIRIYKNLLATAEYRKDALLEYRFGQALMSAGAISDAVHALESAVEHLQRDYRLEPKDVFRALIPRQLGYALWRLSLEQTNGLRIDLLDRAVNATMKSFSEFTPEDLTDRDELREALMYASNNVVSYLGTMHLFGGQQLAQSLFQAYRDEISVWIDATNLLTQTKPLFSQTLTLLDLLAGKILKGEVRKRSIDLLEAMDAMNEQEKREQEELRGYVNNLVKAIDEYGEDD